MECQLLRCHVEVDDAFDQARISWWRQADLGPHCLQTLCRSHRVSIAVKQLRGLFVVLYIVLVGILIMCTRSPEAGLQRLHLLQQLSMPFIHFYPAGLQMHWMHCVAGEVSLHVASVVSTPGTQEVGCLTAAVRLGALLCQTSVWCCSSGKCHHKRHGIAWEKAATPNVL